MKRRRFTRYLVKSLIREPVKKIEIKGKWISFEFDGTKIKNEIVIRKHEKYVGTWAKTRNKVYIDDNLRGKRDVNAIALHESIEKYVSQKYGLDEDKEAHEVATAKEKMFLERIDGKWKKHEKKVEKVWKLEGKH